METILEIKRLSKQYKSGRGVTDIDMILEPGDVYALLGPNGAGKTTILKTITGLLKKDDGMICLNHIELEENYEIFIRSLGAMIGATSHLEYLTGYEQLKIKANYFEVESSELDRLLQLVGLYTYKDEKIKGYSTGMKQRLALAFALVGKPKILLLDEPFSGMDVDGKRQMRQLLHMLATQEQMAIIISSHLVTEIESIYTKMSVLQEGHLLCTVEKEMVEASGLSLEDYYVNKSQAFRKANPLNLEQVDRRKAV